MKILLIGEYSRLHNSLKEGLVSLGHEVIIVGTGDGFKNYNVDYTIYPKLIGRSTLLRKIKNGIYRFTGIDIEKTEKGIRFYFLLPKLKGYDHVQLINSDAIETHPALQIKLYKKLFVQNKKTSLLVCGDETPVIDCLLKGEIKNSVLSPYLANKSLWRNFNYTLKYTTKSYRRLFEWVNNNVGTLITSDLDYKIPMDRMGYKNTLIPNPVNTNTIAFSPLKITHKVVLFLGINRHSYLKKGIVYFEEALAIIQQKYPDKAEIIITENVPYTEYTKLYKKAHILLDYVYGYDQGYNALEAMAAGKVVFTGAGPDFMRYYNLSESVAINALPDVDHIINELSYLIENPAEIEAIGDRARAFIEKEHNYISIAQRYLEVWGDNFVN